MGWNDSRSAHIANLDPGYADFHLPSQIDAEEARRVYGETIPEPEIKRLAQAHYAHIWRLVVEFLWFPLVPMSRRARLVRVENEDVLRRAHAQGKGVLILTGVYARHVALILIPVMAAASTVHIANGWVFSNAGGGWEYPAFLIVASFALWLLGDGAFALRSRPLWFVGEARAVTA